MAHEDPEFMNAASKGKAGTGHYHCPRCNIPLSQIVYEGVSANQCPVCNGVLVPEKDVMRVIIREEVGFPERIIRIAAGIVEEAKLWRDTVIKRDPHTMLTCPKCDPKMGKMMRMFYTAAYHVEIDKCLYCGLIWFDKDELEALQCLIEHQTKQK